jgi:cytochrome b involved in lipid metabolism
VLGLRLLRWIWNGVWDQVSNWYDHPGGSVIFTHAGDDFTDIFAAFHPPSANDALEAFYIGEAGCRLHGCSRCCVF